MNLEQYSNYELWLRFNKLDQKNDFLNDDRWPQKVVNAYIDILLIPGVQDDTKHSRQTIINFIREQEELQQSTKSRRQMEGGRKRRSRKSRRNKSRRNKSRRNKSRKSRRSRK